MLSQLPSLHQLNLRGCPIADTPDYHAQLLQQLPMLDVLDSRKVHKSSTHGSAKPAVPTAQSKPSLDRQAKSKPDVAGAARTVDSPVKNRKRQLQSQTEMLGAPVLKKIKNERVAASYDAMGTADGQTRTIATASKLGEKPGGGDDAEVERKRLKSGKKPKSKEGKKNPQQQATAAYSSRSFLADVLDPEEPDVAAKPAAKVENQQMSAAVATAGDSKASGLVKVVDIHKSQKNKKRTKHGNEAENKSGDNRASGLSGSSAAQVLQSGFGLAALQVGLGGSGAWN